MNENFKKIADIYKILGDPVRVEIMSILSHGSLCVCSLLESFSITQPTLSYHLKLMEKHQLITSEKKGTWVYYSVNHPFIDQFQNQFINLIRPSEKIPLGKVCE